MVTCGNCTRTAKNDDAGILVAVGSPVKHDSAADVRACYSAPVSRLRAALDEEYRAEAEAECRAEAAAERFYEEGTEAQRLQYAWEVEMDERNAAFWSGRF